VKIKEKVIREAMTRIEKRMVKVQGLLDASPLSEICDLRIKACEIMEEHKGDYDKIGKLIGPMAEKEKRLFVLAKRQTKDSNKWIDELVKLGSELGELKNEMWRMERTEI
jgi:hypothetical protein